MLDAEWTGRARRRPHRAGRHVRDRGTPRGRGHARRRGAVGYPVPDVLWEEPRRDGARPPVLRHGARARRSPHRRGRAGRHGALARRPPPPRRVRRRGARRRRRPTTRPPSSPPRSSTGARSTARPCRRGSRCWTRPSTGSARTCVRPDRPSIVHGDPGPGNALQDDSGVTAVIDWEFAHAGDAAEDWAYLALIRGRRLGHAGRVEGAAAPDGRRRLRRGDLARLGGVQPGQGRLREPHRARRLPDLARAEPGPARDRGRRAPALPRAGRGVDP